MLGFKRVMGEDRVLYAMAYPYEYVADEVRAHDDPDVSVATKKKLMQTNAERVVQASTERDPPTALPKGAWWALTLVALAQAMGLLDRQILAIPAPAIKADLKVGDAEMGLLYGTVFALF